jgi:antitoxin component of MazEF toxin-antitoxin module
MRGKVIRRDGELMVIIPEDVAARENLVEGTEVEVTLVQEPPTPVSSEVW